MASRPTKAEAAWIKKFQALMQECPSKHLAAYKVGDPFITIYDKTKDKMIDAIHGDGCGEFCGAVEKAGAELATVNMPFQVHSTSG